MHALCSTTNTHMDFSLPSSKGLNHKLKSDPLLIFYLWLHPGLGLLHPIPTEPENVLSLFLFLLPLPVQFSFPFSLTSSFLLSHINLFPSLPDFLCLGVESSCALWKASLKTWSKEKMTPSAVYWPSCVF